MAEQLRRFLRLKQVKERVGLGRTSIYEKIRSGEFPAPYPLSDDGRAVGWLSDDVEAWIDARINAERQGREAA